ncbi:MAG: GNAT family N-acetyltransferase [Spirochaetota bacterium]
MDRSEVRLPEMIRTERLSIRPYREGDGRLYYAAGVRNREHLSRFETGNPIRDLRDEEHAESFVRGLRASWDSRESFFFGVFLGETDEWVGQVYVGPRNWDLPEFAIGYVGDADHLGKGYMTEAVGAVVEVLVRDAGALRVSADCSEDNEKSRRLLERCGFTREGHLRENRRYADGTIHGDYLYGLLRREFLAGNRSRR